MARDHIPGSIEPGGGRVRVAVIGGGITGLAAAFELSGPPDDPGDPSDPDAPEVVLFEEAPALGGKLRSAVVGGRVVDTGPDGFLARRPELSRLCRELGVERRLVGPGATGAAVYSRGRLRSLPAGLALGIPTRLGPLARSGVLGPAGLIRAALDMAEIGRPALAHVAPPDGPPPEDEAIGAIVTRRLGRQVAERLADPLIGGIHAGSVDDMSAAAVFPALLGAARSGGSLMRGLRSPVAAARREPPSSPAVFATLRDGMASLAEHLAGVLTARGVKIATDCRVESLERDRSGWVVATGAGENPVHFDGLVIAVPAWEASRLVRSHHAAMASMLSSIEYSSVAVVTMVLDDDAMPRSLRGTGFLVPASAGRLVTACTWLDAKWPHLRRSRTRLLRASAGRYGDLRHTSLDDRALVDTLLEDLRTTSGLSGRPLDLAVTRWPDAFPQYRPGHISLVEQIEAAAAELPHLAVAGAAYHGVGVPACVGDGRAAARRVLGSLRSARGVDQALGEASR